MIEPSVEQVERVINLGVVVRVGGGYDYSEYMKKSVKDFLNKKRGAFENLKLQRQVADFTLPVILAYPKDTKREVKLLGTVALFTLWHIKRVNLNYNFKKDKDSANLLYTLFYLDHLIPDLEVS